MLVRVGAKSPPTFPKFITTDLFKWKPPINVVIPAPLRRGADPYQRARRTSGQIQRIHFLWTFWHRKKMISEHLEKSCCLVGGRLSLLWSFVVPTPISSLWSTPPTFSSFPLGKTYNNTSTSLLCLFPSVPHDRLAMADAYIRQSVTVRIITQTAFLRATHSSRKGHRDRVGIPSPSQSMN